MEAPNAELTSCEGAMLLSAESSNFWAGRSGPGLVARSGKKIDLFSRMPTVEEIGF